MPILQTTATSLPSLSPKEDSLSEVNKLQNTNKTNSKLCIATKNAP